MHQWGAVLYTLIAVTLHPDYNLCPSTAKTVTDHVTTLHNYISWCCVYSDIYIYIGIKLF